MGSRNPAQACWYNSPSLLLWPHQMELRRGFSAVADFGRRNPYLFGVGVSSLKTCSADLVAQKVVERREHVDWRRNLVFFCWGTFYLGCFQYFLYVRVFARYLFPSAGSFAAKPLREKLRDTAGQKAVVQQVFLDQFVHHPFCFFPCFYQVQALVQGDSPSDGWNKMKSNWLTDLQVLWQIWVPAFFINFSFCPTWMRVPFVSLVSLGYTIILSCMRGTREIKDSPAEEAQSAKGSTVS